MLVYFFISLNLTQDQLIYETNLSDNDNDPAAAEPAGPGPTLSSCTTVHYTTLFMCVCHIQHITHDILCLIRQTFLLKFILQMLHVL